MERRRRAHVEDGKERIKKIQAAKAAFEADHLARDKIQSFELFNERFNIL